MSKKVLLVDDSLFMRNMMKDILNKNFECEIIEAETGPGAEATFNKEKPDVTLLDIVMPEGDEEGVRVLEAIKKTDPNAKIIMVTAVGHEMVIEKCKGLGVEEYIIKPLDEDTVIEVLEKCLGEKKAAQ